jgi:hypothetical protein
LMKRRRDRILLVWELRRSGPTGSTRPLSWICSVRSPYCTYQTKSREYSPHTVLSEELLRLGRRRRSSLLSELATKHRPGESALSRCASWPPCGAPAVQRPGQLGRARREASEGDRGTPLRVCSGHGAHGRMPGSAQVWGSHCQATLPWSGRCDLRLRVWRSLVQTQMRGSIIMPCARRKSAGTPRLALFDPGHYL